MSYILTINAGSSSIKTDIFEAGPRPTRLATLTIGGIGQGSSVLSFGMPGHQTSSELIQAEDHAAAARHSVEIIKRIAGHNQVLAVGHRIVHGGPRFFEPTVIDDQVLASLIELAVYDPGHIPAELELIKDFRDLFPGVSQIACFDTAFHHDLPTPARLLAIPRRYEALGVRRYGFHGLSYEYLLAELGRQEPALAQGRVIMAHMGSGVSLAAVVAGKSIDTTMGLTPASGVPMSTRSGDLDPGLAVYMKKSENIDAEQLNDMANKQSGLLGISELSADMEVLLAQAEFNSQAQDAIDLFCYQIKKMIGSYAAAMGGVDAVVFSGGMGQKAPKIRAQITQGLDFLGIKIDESANQANQPVISDPAAKVSVRVIPTDEASIIATHSWQLLKGAGQ